ncbi:MAG: GIY-YIG nuclease family protein [Nitrospirae bacterium]|jgi:predicted GIY-YIG superfamily endonuclease|nr:GIY-YIG nuclease family protein [Nitrospirota bacterium]
MKVKLYIIKGTASGKHYIGITNNSMRRLQEHSRGETKGGQIVGEFELVYGEIEIM